MSSYDPLTLPGVIQRHALEKPDFAVVTIEGAGRRADEVRSYAALMDKGRALAAGLQKLGVQPGERVGALLANHIEFIDLMVASALAGATLVPIDPRTRGDKLVYMLAAARCKCVIAADYALPELLAVREKISGLAWVVGLITDEGRASAEQLQAAGVRPYGEVASADASHHVLPGAAADGAMELIYTSGTTGDPKGIVLTHRRYCETASLTPRLFGVTAADVLYSGLSLTHANAQVVTLGTALVNAIPCVLSRRFSKSRLWDITRQYGCTQFTLLGGMTTALYAEPPRANDADNPVRVVISAGMPAAIWNEFRARFQVEIHEFYGAAEGGLTSNPPGVGPVGSIGKPIPTLEHRLVDEAGADAPKDAQGERTGELWFRAKDGSPFKVDYDGNPEASAKKCAGGWLHMGDIVREDKDGWLYFLHRAGSGIRRNGEFINTAYIEKAVAESPAVDDVYVYGIPAASGAPGEKDVVAAVVPKPGAEFDAAALYRLLRQKLEPGSVPSWIQVLEQIPKTASEKPQDHALIAALKTNPGIPEQKA